MHSSVQKQAKYKESMISPSDESPPRIDSRCVPYPGTHCDARSKERQDVHHHSNQTGTTL